MRLTKIVAGLAMALCAGAAMGQSGPWDGGPPSLGSVGSQADPAKAVNVMLTMFEHQLMGVVNAMPADKFAFAPATSTFSAAQGAKYEGVLTFAGEAKHLAQANYFFFSTLTGEKPGPEAKAIGSLTRKEDIVAALAASFAYAHKQAASITAANAFEVIKGADGLQTRATVSTFAVAHGFDHYGQMVEYLRMNGIVPPGSK